RARDGYRLWFQHHFNAAIAFLVEQAIRLGRLLKREAVRDEERRVDLVLANAFQQWPHEAVHVGLTHLEGQPLGEGGAERQLVEQAALLAGNRNRPALAASHNRLA